MEIRAIETQYRGCRFRSRTEGRHAVLFDFLDIRWEYEAQGFEFGDFRYLPDFWFRFWRVFVEVKGEATAADQRKARDLANLTACTVYLVCGTPDWDALVECFGPAGRHEWIKLPEMLRRLGADDDRIAASIIAARSARFEFGESGAPAAAANDNLPLLQRRLNRIAS